MSTSQTNSRLTTHPVTLKDKTAMAALRSIVEPNKGRMQGPAARPVFDGIMKRVGAPVNVTFSQESVAGISGWSCKPEGARPGEIVIHLHGGWFNWGSAEAFRHLVGHIAARAGVEAFIPDFRLAPEHPFPAAVNDVLECYEGLVDQGFRRIAITGDSAGGCLALVLLSLATTKKSMTGLVPVGAVALSPVTDLALTGDSWNTRALADPYFTRLQVTTLVNAYLGSANAKDPLVSPLYGNLAGLPAIRIHVGDDETLLDDSRRYFDRAADAGVDVTLDIWEGMPHGFLSGTSSLDASSQALDAIGAFLTERLTSA